MSAFDVTISPVTQPRIQLMGLSIRTRNEVEMTPGAGKIPGLWESFYQNIAPKLATGTTVYGIYSNYESDHTGLFNLSAAVATSDLPSESKDCVASEIQAGRYLKFRAKTPSEDPVKQVIGLWQQVWAYFADDGCAHQRAYTSDFECYQGSQGVELFIAIK